MMRGWQWFIVYRVKTKAGCDSEIWNFKAAFVLERSSEVFIIYISDKSGFSALTVLFLSELHRFYCVLLSEL